jgi:hypothetical protein
MWANPERRARNSLALANALAFVRGSLLGLGGLGRWPLTHRGRQSEVKREPSALAVTLLSPQGGAFLAPCGSPPRRLRD